MWRLAFYGFIALIFVLRVFSMGDPSGDWLAIGPQADPSN
jgi:hypothetical protein